MSNHPGPKPRASFFDSPKVMPVTESGCWIWTGRLLRGYGQTVYKGKNSYAHRHAYEEVYGLIPEGMFVLHKCDTPSCCNPSHLQLGTQKENMQDMVRKGRACRSYPSNQGEKHFAAKLTNEIVMEIRASNESGFKLAKKYGVGASTISRVRNNAKAGGWAHVQNK